MTTQAVQADEKVGAGDGAKSSALLLEVDAAAPTPLFTRADRLSGAIRLLRPKQWVKNAFVVAPLLFSHTFLQIPAVSATALAFAYFCVTASATYVLNDIGDRERDRLHPTKRFKRPIAAGLVSVPVARLMLVALWLVILSSALWDLRVFGVLIAYSLMNIAYSRWLKHQPVVDIFIIAIGFVLRVVAGSFAIQAPVSSWMCITVLCLALYLAAIKRLQELKSNGTTARASLDRYSVPLVQRYAEMSAGAALAFYSMFVLTQEAHLAVTIPFVIFGLFRYWWVVEHEGRGESPTEALLRDWQLIAACLGWTALCVWTLAPAA